MFESKATLINHNEKKNVLILKCIEELKKNS